MFRGVNREFMSRKMKATNIYLIEYILLIPLNIVVFLYFLSITIQKVENTIFIPYVLIIEMSIYMSVLTYLCYGCNFKFIEKAENRNIFKRLLFGNPIIISAIVISLFNLELLV